MSKGLMIIWLLSMGIASSAQLYQTQSGTIQVNGRYRGASVTAGSKHLFMHVDYDRAEMHMRLKISNLSSEDDSLNELLHTMAGQKLAFEGKMNTAFVQTKSHPKQKIKTEGMMFINGISKPFSFSSVLEHFPRGNTSCILSGEFIIDLKQFNIDNLPPGEEKITVKFTQLVLKKSGD